mgnify:CR=1 FL=1
MLSSYIKMGCLNHLSAAPETHCAAAAVQVVLAGVERLVALVLALAAVVVPSVEAPAVEARIVVRLSAELARLGCGSMTTVHQPV